MSIDLSNVNSFGCVLMANDIPHLFILDDNYLLDGIPFFDDSEIYMTLYDNEMIIVGISIKDEDGEEIDYDIIDDENYDEMTYVVTPLKFHTLKTQGLTNDDIIDLDLMDMLVNSLIDEYLENLD